MSLLSAPLRRPFMLAIGTLLLLSLAFGTADLVEHSHSAGEAAAAPPIDQRLVLYRHTVLIQGTFRSSVTFTAAIYPALPGVNTVRLVPRSSGYAPFHPRSLNLIAAMTDMTMTPTRGLLARHGHSYFGTINLPMFGRYQVRMTATSGPVRQMGVMSVTLPL